MYKYIHLIGVHYPFRMDDNIKTNQNGDLVSTGKSSLKIVKALLNKLEENNAYDNSIIFIVADHGVMHLNEINYAKPLFLFKDYSIKQKEMKINKANISLGDIPNTIFTRTNNKLNPFGREILSIKENEDRI